MKKIAPNKASADRSMMLSRKKLDAAEIILAQGVFDFALIASYTAMFHAARAILYRDGVKERSHECIPIYIAGNYPELRSYANLLDSYRIFRHDAIYGLDTVVTQADAEAALREAKGFLEKMKSLLE